MEKGIHKSLRTWMESRFQGKVRFDEPMSRRTSFRLGGPADAFVRPESIDAFRELYSRANRTGTPIFIMGAGTNLLVRDGGIRGVVVAPGRGMDRIYVRERVGGEFLVRVMAGTKLARMCRLAIHQGLGGLQFALGIPGAFGGGIRMNAGAGRGAMGDVIESIEIMSLSGDIDRIARKDITFAYRRMDCDAFAEDGRQENVILGADILLHRDDSERLRREADEILAARRRRQPAGASAGSFFKNPSTGQSAGMLIDKAGLRGRRIGNVQISEHHANFFINRGGGRAADAIALMETAQIEVRKRFHVELTPEVHIVGTET